MADDNPTLAELGISGRAANVLKAAGLETRSALEDFGLDRIEEVKGIGSDYADEIRAKVAASYEQEPSAVEPEDDSPEVGDPAPEASEAETVEPSPIDRERLEQATLTLAAGILGHPAAGPLLTPPFQREADLARKARVLAEAVIREIDQDDQPEGAE